MESNMPARATVSAVIRAGPFMFLFFSFRSCDAIAHFLNHASGTGRENPKPDWPNCTPAASKQTVFFDSQCFLVPGQNRGCHQTDLIDSSRMTNVDDLSNLPEAQPVVALDEQDALCAVGVDGSKSRL